MHSLTLVSICPIPRTQVLIDNLAPSVTPMQNMLTHIFVSVVGGHWYFTVTLLHQPETQTR